MQNQYNISLHDSVSNAISKLNTKTQIWGNYTFPSPTHNKSVCTLQDRDPLKTEGLKPIFACFFRSSNCLAGWWNLVLSAVQHSCPCSGFVNLALHHKICLVPLTRNTKSVLPTETPDPHFNGATFTTPGPNIYFIYSLIVCLL